MKKSQLFALSCLAFIGGIILSQLIQLPWDNFYNFVAAISLLILIVTLWIKKNFGLTVPILFGTVFLLLGIWRFGLSQPIIDKNHIANYHNQTIKLTGRVVDEPDIRLTRRKLTIGRIKAEGIGFLKGRILVNAPNYPEYNYGDLLQVKCELTAGGIIEDFDYGKFLNAKNIYAVCHQPENILLINNNLTISQEIRQRILAVKYKYKQIVDHAVPYPQSEILASLVLGLRRGIPENILNNFRQTGLSHIIAVSGLNVSIITLLLMNGFIAIGFRRRYAFAAATISLIIFLIMIGFQASSIRAGIMGFAALLAMQVGRLKNGINLLLLAAFILLLINPKLLLGDVGFQLSFLAMLGIMYLGQPIEKFLERIRVPKFFEIRSSLMMTLSAQAMVLPLIVYYFGNLSVIAPVANALILPLLPLITISGFGLGIVGFIILPLAHFIGYIIAILIGWIMMVTSLGARLPYGSFNLEKIDFVWIALIYILIGWSIRLLKTKKFS
ncbi:hypothetical protein A3B87_00415 [Candidatus Kuenenbacteria bacterium RIFCSPHIGHO2_02_FULL_39_13]|uniref:ComEC/Rec2-related protein domain-containing protein n=1 Tax=Candidatus Kuenenbacteria bacterium RIFCSPHIGHO2_02_FULL_39_13 TaxID=1798561 RepID=A0A1F6FKU3_9BACT|nr:MAG: hypothetical protein A3B87_00415 [Candidatus Kuenenbacteria bacterium RIFCSPHIGHO2_02_FULL_39_13]